MKKYFYPRPPRGGRRVGLINPLYHVVISIHALREEGDPLYPIRPHQSGLFLSTPSARRATPVPHPPPSVGAISIHALREEGDGSRSIMSTRYRDFYPRPPRGGRHGRFIHPGACVHFYPRPPRGGRQLSNRLWLGRLFISIHALREEGDTVSTDGAALGQKFLSTPSARRATSSYASLRLS